MPKNESTLNSSTLVDNSQKKAAEAAAAEASPPSPSPSPSPTAAERTPPVTGYAYYNHMAEQMGDDVKLALADTLGAKETSAKVVAAPPVKQELEEKSFVQCYGMYNFLSDKRELREDKLALASASTVRQSERVRSPAAQQSKEEGSCQCYARFDM